MAVNASPATFVFRRIARFAMLCEKSR